MYLVSLAYHYFQAEVTAERRAAELAAEPAAKLARQPQEKQRQPFSIEFLDTLFRQRPAASVGSGACETGRRKGRVVVSSGSCDGGILAARESNCADDFFGRAAWQSQELFVDRVVVVGVWLWSCGSLSPGQHLDGLLGFAAFVDSRPCRLLCAHHQPQGDGESGRWAKEEAHAHLGSDRILSLVIPWFLKLFCGGEVPLALAVNH